jgi:glycosyltransferase involved in cell wall biosynthesis
MMRKLVSIIIPAYNEQNFIRPCLDSVLDQTIDSGIYEVLVVDNHSSDRTAAIARSRRVSVVHEPRKGYVHALRKGIEASTGEILAFTDADCRVPRDWISSFQDHFESSPDLVAVGGKLAFYGLDPMLERITRLILSLTSTLPGGNMAVRRTALERIGGIQADFNLSLDYWLTIELRAAGKIKIDKRLIVLTSGRRFQGAFFSQIKYPCNVVSLRLRGRPLFHDFPDVRGKPG